LDFISRRVESRENYLNAMEEFQPDLILSDNTLPSFDGLSALSIAREKLPDAPFIFVSGTIGEEQAIESLKHGAMDYVLKTNLSKLVPAVKRALNEVKERIERKQTEQSLKESEERFRAVFDTANDGILVALTADKKFYLANKAICRMLGYGMDEIKNIGVADIHPKNDLPYVISQFERQMRGEIDVALNLPVKRKDGTVFYADINASSLKLGNKEYLLGIFRDITERKKGEEGIAMRSTMLDNTTDSVFLLDFEGRFIYANKAAYETRGYAKEEFMKMNLADLDTPEYAKQIKARMEQIMEKGSQIFETAHICKDGLIMPVEAHVSIIELDNKKCLLSILRDTTERKKAEIMLVENEEKYRNLVENINDMVQSVKPDGSFVYVNRAWQETLGYDEDEISGLSLFDIIHPDSLPHCTETFKRVLAGEKASGIEAKFVAKDGRIVIVEGNVRSLFKDGKPVTTYGIFRDITERKLAEEEIRKRRDIETAINSILKISLENISLGDILKKTLDNILAIPWLSLQSRGAIFLAEEPNTLVMKAQNGLHQELLKKCARVPFGTCICGKAASTREIQFRGRITPDHETTCPGIIPHGHYCTPIIFNQKTLGVINLYVKEGHEQDKKEVELLSAIANTLAGIIQRKQAEKELAENEEKFRSLVQNLSDIILVLDDKMLIKYISPSVERILGYAPDNLIGKTPMDYIHPNEISATAESFADTLKKPGINQPFTMRIRDKKGGWVWFETIGNNLLGNPVINGIVVTARDITTQYLAEEEMRKLSSVVEQTADLVVVTDKEGFIQYVNPSFQKLTGYTEKELAGKTPRVLKSERYDKTFYENMWQTILSGKSFSTEFTNRKKNGELYYEEKTITPVKDARGIITSFVSIGSDITAHKNMENQLQQSQKMEAVGSLAGGIAHDFNNILTTIQGYTDLVMEEMGRQSPLYGDMEHIKNASLRAGNLTQQLLLFSRKKPRELANIDIHKTINNMLPMLKPMIGENIKIIPALEANPYMIKADEGNMEQVIMNIVINARDAMPKGGVIHIKTENASIDAQYCKSIMQARPGEFICLSITDTGTGMDKEIIPNIFEPFFTTKEKGKGTGLGLATVYGIVKQHEGWINVYSELGHGSTFKVYLPSEAPEQEEMPFANDGTRPGKKKKSEILVPEKGNGERILLVEDDEEIRQFTLKVLGKNGYNVSAASTVKEALDIFLKEKGAFDLVLSDVVLPDGNGLELASQLRLAKPTLPIIIASGYTDKKIEVNGLKEKGYKFIQKPYNTIHLLKMIKESITSK